MRNKKLIPFEVIEKAVDSSAVKNWFMDVCAVGASAASKNAATFVMLKSGEIKDSTNTKTTTKSAKAKTTPKTKSDEKFTNKSRMPADTPSVINSHQPMPSTNGTSEAVPSVHIDLQIHISPEASPSQIDAIFASMAKHLYGRR